MQPKCAQRQNSEGKESFQQISIFQIRGKESTFFSKYENNPKIINHCEQADLDLIATPKAFRRDPGLSTPLLKKIQEK